MKGNAIITVILVLVSAGIIVAYIPRILVGRREQYSRKEFTERYPKFAWLKGDLVIEFVWFVFLMLCFAGGIKLFQDKPLSLGLFSIVPAGLALTNGLLVAITGIYRVPHYHNVYTYLYEPRLRYVGWVQFLAAAVVITTAIILVIFSSPV